MGGIKKYINIFGSFTELFNCSRTRTLLAHMFAYFPGVPATSTSSERSFSLTGRTLEKRRMQLGATVLMDFWSRMDLMQMTDYGILIN